MSHVHEPIVALIATAPGLEGQAPINPVRVAESIGADDAAAILSDLGNAISATYGSTMVASDDLRRHAIADAIESTVSALDALRAIEQASQ